MNYQFATYSTFEEADEASLKYGMKAQVQGQSARVCSPEPMLDGRFALPLFNGISDLDWSSHFDGESEELSPEDFWDPGEYYEQHLAEHEDPDG